MENKRIETRRRGYGVTGRRRNGRDESVEYSVSEVGRCNKKARALASRGGNAPPPPNFQDPTQCLPQAKLSSSVVDACSPNFSSEAHVEETFLIDFPSKTDSWSTIGFVDEEEMFNMPVLVDSMAEGMLLTPPAMKRGFKWSHDVDEANYIDLWGQ